MSLGSIVSSTVSIVLSYFGDPLLLHLGYPFKTKENVVKLIDFFRRLEARRDDINTEIDIAQRKLQACKHEVKEWLQQVELVRVEVDAIKDAYDTRTRYLGVFSLNVMSSYRISKRAAKKLNELIMLYDRGSFEIVVVDLPPPSIEEKPVSLKVMGMQSNLEKILSCLSDEKDSVIGVWGMGGVGKTTLLKMINNHLFGGVENFHFDHVICVAASKDCKLENLQMNIVEKVGLYLKQDSGMESHAAAIFNYLKNKKFLLLLDDLWEQVDLERVGIPYPNGHKNQKIVLATRFEGICGKMKAHKKIKLECLEPDEAWELFKDNVSEETIYSDERIEYLARKVCDKCSGLPLALITVGQTMSTKRTWQEWESAIASLRNTKLSGFSGMKDVIPILSALKFTYDSLEDDQLKECFLSCSLWPEGYSIWTVGLVDCWMGLGLLPMGRTIKETYNEGYSRIERLKKVCLLECGDKRSEVRLHDVIRDMALWIVSECGDRKLNWFVQAGLGLKRIAKDDVERWAGATKISVMCNFIESVPCLPNCPKLSTLMLQQNYHLKIIPPMFFQSMTSLTYLDLGWTRIKELPSDIGFLVSLQYFNLSESDISSLPQQLGELRQLRFLNLSYTDHLRKIPHGVISRLSMLKVLLLFQSAYAGFETETCGTCMNDNGSGLLGCPHTASEKREFSLTELHCLDRGLTLGITVRTVRALHMLSMLSDTYLYLLGLDKLEGESSLRLKLQSTFQVLNVKLCLSLEELSIEIEHDDNFHQAVSRLEFLTFWRLPKLAMVNLAEQLPYLRKLTIVENNGLTDITWVQKLPHLEELDLSFCNKLKQVVANAENGNNRQEDQIHGFSRLRILQMNHLPNLERVCSLKWAFPSLEYVDVFGCPLLKELPFQSKSDCINSLRQIRGEEEWWNNLEWDTNATRLVYLQFFRVFEKNLENFQPDLDINPFMSSTSSFFARRDPMVRTALQFSSYLSLLFGPQMLK